MHRRSRSVPPQDPAHSPAGTVLARGRTAEVVAWGRGRVLKRFREDVPREAIAQEAVAARVVEACGLPAPRLLEEVAGDGCRGLVFEWAAGPTMLAELSARPWRLRRVAGELAGLQVAVHEAPGAGLPSLRDHLAALVANAPLDPSVRARALAALDRLPDGDRLCHGDLHPGNVVLTADGPRVVDWANATCGHPDGDAARTRLLLQVAAVPPGAMLAPVLESLRNRFCRAWLDAYRRRRPAADLDAWEGVVATARLAEGIDGEAPALSRIVGRAFGRAGS